MNQIELFMFIIHNRFFMSVFVVRGRRVPIFITIRLEVPKLLWSVRELVLDFYTYRF